MFVEYHISDFFLILLVYLKKWCFFQVAVCNLASISLKQFVKTEKNPPQYDFQKLFEVTKVNPSLYIDNHYCIKSPGLLFIYYAVFTF